MLNNYYTTDMRPDGLCTYVQCKVCNEKLLNYSNSTLSIIDECLNCRSKRLWKEANGILEALPHKGKPKFTKPKSHEAEDDK